GTPRVAGHRGGCLSAVARSRVCGGRRGGRRDRRPLRHAGGDRGRGRRDARVGHDGRTAASGDATGDRRVTSPETTGTRGSPPTLAGGRAELPARMKGACRTGSAAHEAPPPTSTTGAPYQFTSVAPWRDRLVPSDPSARRPW